MAEIPSIDSCLADGNPLVKHFRVDSLDMRRDDLIAMIQPANPSYYAAMVLECPESESGQKSVVFFETEKRHRLSVVSSTLPTIKVNRCRNFGRTVKEVCRSALEMGRPVVVGDRAGVRRALPATDRNATPGKRRSAPSPSGVPTDAERSSFPAISSPDQLSLSNRSISAPLPELVRSLLASNADLAQRVARLEQSVSQLEMASRSPDGDLPAISSGSPGHSVQGQSSESFTSSVQGESSELLAGLVQGQSSESFTSSVQGASTMSPAGSQQRESGESACGSLEGQSTDQSLQGQSTVSLVAQAASLQLEGLTEESQSHKHTESQAGLRGVSSTPPSPACDSRAQTGSEPRTRPGDTSTSPSQREMSSSAGSELASSPTGQLENIVATKNAVVSKLRSILIATSQPFTCSSNPFPTSRKLSWCSWAQHS